MSHMSMSIASPIESQSGNNPCRATWDLEKDAFLIFLLQEQVNRGKRADSGFKKEAWTSVTDDFNKRFTVIYKLDQIKARQKLVYYIYSVIVFVIKLNFIVVKIIVYYLSSS